MNNKVLEVLLNELNEFKKLSFTDSDFFTIQLSSSNKLTNITLDSEGIHVYREEHFAE